MSLYRYSPLPSDRMGTLWTLCSIEDAYIIEFGPSGNTSFAPEGFRSLNAQLNANVFTTHMTENDISLGNIDNLIKAIKEVDEKYEPNIIFILASSLVAVTGTDIVGICTEIQSQVKSRLIPADEGGYIGDYTYGIRNAMKLLCSKVVESHPTKKSCDRKYNIIGSQIDYYNYRADAKEIKRFMKEYYNLECNTVFTSESSMKGIASAADAEFNIVMRSEGIDAAEVLQKRFDQPYIFGRPYGIKSTTAFLESISKITGKNIDSNKLSHEISECKNAIFNVKKHIGNQKLRYIISGNYDLVLGINEFLKEVGIEDVLGIINHKLKGVKYVSDDISMSNIKINPSEDEVQDYLADFKPDVVLGDSNLLELSKNIKDVCRYQISNPNQDSFRFYDGTPFIGFNGVLYLSEVLCNILNIEHNH